MARIRTIKPEFWTDEKIVSLSPLARLLFIGIWNFVDECGRAVYSPIRLKMQILPAESVEIGGILRELVDAKLIVVYSIEDKDYFQVANFTKHQKIDPRYPSKIPPPPKTPPTSTDFHRKVAKEKEKEREDTSSSLRSEEDAPSAPRENISENNLDVRTVLFRQGLADLAALSGRPPTRLRSMLGKWLRDTNDDALRVLTLIAKANQDRPAEPLGWIERHLRNGLATGPPRRRMRLDPLGNPFEDFEADPLGNPIH
jgi:hypothetical protein